jgi:hypothetical protein
MRKGISPGEGSEGREKVIGEGSIRSSEQRGIWKHYLVCMLATQRGRSLNGGVGDNDTIHANLP